MRPRKSQASLIFSPHPTKPQLPAYQLTPLLQNHFPHGIWFFFFFLFSHSPPPSSSLLWEGFPGTSSGARVCVCVCVGWRSSHCIRSLEPVTHPLGGRDRSDLSERARPVQSWVLPPTLQRGHGRMAIPRGPRGPGEGGRHHPPRQAALTTLGPGNRSRDGGEREPRITPTLTHQLCDPGLVIWPLQ